MRVAVERVGARFVALLLQLRSRFAPLTAPLEALGRGNRIEAATGVASKTERKLQ